MIIKTKLIKSLEKNITPFNFLVEQMKDEFKLNILMSIAVVIITIFIIVFIFYGD